MSMKKMMVMLYIYLDQKAFTWYFSFKGGNKIKKTCFIVVFCSFCVAVVWYVVSNETEKKVYGVVTNVYADELVFEDEKQTEYIIQKKDYDFTKNQLKTKDKIVVKFEGEILEVSPAKFKKIINIEKERE
ncbi:hypothetical protein QW920_000610 [Listeria monocytogenes]|nr:hypothetical protein [Listeria monocytogenes]